MAKKKLPDYEYDAELWFRSDDLTREQIARYRSDSLCVDVRDGDTYYYVSPEDADAVRARRVEAEKRRELYEAKQDAARAEQRARDRRQAEKATTRQAQAAEVTARRHARWIKNLKRDKRKLAFQDTSTKLYCAYYWKDRRLYRATGRDMSHLENPRRADTFAEDGKFGWRLHGYV
jgi:hypothetical protein